MKNRKERTLHLREHLLRERKHRVPTTGQGPEEPTRQVVRLLSEPLKRRSMPVGLSNNRSDNKKFKWTAISSRELSMSTSSWQQ